MTSSRSYTDIIFDLDGTIVDSAEGIRNAFQYAFDQVGVRPIGFDFNQLIGPPPAESLKRFLPNEFSDEIFLTSTIQVMRNYYASHGIHQCQLYPGIEMLLKNLKQNNKRLFIATAKPMPFAKENLSNLGIYALFDGVEGNPIDAAPHTKAAIIARVMKTMHGELSDRKFVMIGDRYHDIEGAHENGIDSIGVTYGYGTSEELTSYRPTIMVSSIQELHGVL